jgi:hypothetical protein
MPILFGGPNLNSIALAAGNPSYLDVIAELSGVTVPVKIVLEIFSASKTSYTDSAESYGMCYKAGNSCPEGHLVCKAEYCEMDVWKQLIADFKAAGSVTVLGSLDSSTAATAYDGLDVDGFYLASTVPPVANDCSGQVPYTVGGGSSSGWQDVESSCYENVHISDDVIISKTGAFKGSEETWRQSFNGATHDDYLCPYFWRPHSEVQSSTAPSGVEYLSMTFPSEMRMNGFRMGCDNPNAGNMVEFDIQYLSTGADRDWVTVKNTNYARPCPIGQDGTYNGDGAVGPPVTWEVGPSSEQWRIKMTYHDSSAPCYYGFGWYASDYVDLFSDTVTVSAIGSPLFDEGAVDAATVYVTLAAKDLGVWNPFSWYPYVAPSKWAAIVTEASDLSAVETLVDRGYGWVYVTSEVGFNTKNTLAMSELLAAIESPATRRKLQERRLETSAPYWGCDDTLFECKPICVKTTGLIRTKVSDTLCAGAPKDTCACKCFHEAQWTCEGEVVVCKAKFGAEELKPVGDKVCETRGARKPTSVAELRVASSCEPVTEMRGSAPTAQCLVQWGTTTTDAPAKATQEQAAPEKEKDILLIQESFATTLAVAALALYE